MNNYKIKVNDEAESKEAQGLFEQLGFKWAGDHPENGDWYSHLYAENSTCCYLSPYVWGGLGDRFKELTLPQLRDLVAQSKSKVREYLDPNDNYKLCLINPSDAAHWMIEVPEKADHLLRWQENEPTFYRNKYGERYNRSYRHWDLVEGDEGIDEMICLWSREPIQEQSLISGADALRALADGKEVEYLGETKVWFSLNKETSAWSVTEVLSAIDLKEGSSFKFRLKPRTIKLEIEIPAPFEPKQGEDYFYLAHTNTGYSYDMYESTNFDDCQAQFGAWRTEEEIKQVVAALRGIK